MSRKTVIAANWKMNLNSTEGAKLVMDLMSKMSSKFETEVIICPPFTSLESIGRLISNTAIELGAQNMCWENSGAFTGEISPTMLKHLSVLYVIIGHSERRQFFCEKDENVARKVRSALDNGLKPIICVGETLDQRNYNKTEEVVSGQVLAAVSQVDQEELNNIIIAYEPIWAIGTGVNANPVDANDVANKIRKILNGKFKGVADDVVIQYGGSVNSKNFGQFILQEGIGGALVGGASLNSDEFLSIIEIAEKERKKEIISRG